MSSDQNRLNEINTELVKLQESGTVVMKDLRRSNLKLYKHLARLYFWWRSARNQGDYLETQYASLRRKFKTVKRSINFSPLLWLAFGHNNLDRNSVDRYSRALNAVHIEYEKKPLHYAQERVTKLANFIYVSGGTTKLAGYIVSEDNADVDPVNDSDEIVINEAEDKRKTKEALLALTGILDEYGQKNMLQHDQYISRSAGKFSVLLVEHRADGLNIIDTRHDNDWVDSMLADNLRRRFDVTVFAIRPLLELIQTQCLPKHLEGLVDKLVDKTRLPDEKNKSFNSDRRVLYRPSQNQFILSPMNALSGVVSIVEPFFPLILEGCKKDVFLPLSQRADLESQLLRNFEFNLYHTEIDTPSIPQYPEQNSASHVLHLRHRFKAHQFITLSFWPFYSSVLGPQDQVLIDPDYDLKPTWCARVDHNEIKRLNDCFLENWLNSFAIHLTRDPQAILKITFRPDAWSIEFVYKDGQFENHQDVSIKALEVSDQTVFAYFAPKDIVPALKCLSDLPLTDAEDNKHASTSDSSRQYSFAHLGVSFTSFVPEEARNYKGGVCFELNDNVLCIRFCTLVFGGSEHTIFIPTVDLEGNRATQPFMRYHPEITDDVCSASDEIAHLDEDWPEMHGAEA